LFATLESVQGSEIPKQLIEQKDQVVNGNAKETNHPVEIVLDDWIGGRIREVFRQVDSATQIEIRNRVANLVAKIKNPNQAFRFLTSLGFDLVVEESCLQLAMKLIQAESFLRASSLLKSLTQSEDKEMATKAANLQLQIATKNGMQRQAKLMSAEFKKRDLKVAQQYAEEIESWESDNPDSISPTSLTEIWQSGEVKLQESQNTELASTPLSGNSVIVLSTDNPEVRDYTFQFYPQTGELSVKDAYGVEFRRFSARKKLSRVLTVYNRYWKGRLIVRENFALMDFGREIFAFDWIRLIAGEDPYLWSTKLTGKGVAYMPSVSQKRTWGTTEIVSGIGDFQDRLLIGSVGLNGVCYLDNSQLVCLDAYTGERRWQKKVDSSESTVFGGARHVVVWNGRDRTALVIETATGRSLSICKVPVEAGSIWKNFGSKILLSAKIRSAGNSKEPVGPLEDRDHKRLMLFDLTTGKPVWTKRFEESTLGTPVADNQFAFLDDRCRYRVVDVVSGVESEPIEIPELKPMRPKITGIAVSNYQGKHLIHFRRGNLTENRISLPLLKAEVRYIQFADKMWEGYLLLVDPKHQKVEWERPARFDYFQIMQNQPVMSPFYFLSRRVTSNLRRGGVFIQVVGIEMKTGRIAFNHLGKYSYWVNFEVRCNPEKQSVEIQYAGNKILLKIEDNDQRPPSPVAYLTNSNSIPRLTSPPRRSLLSKKTIEAERATLLKKARQAEKELLQQRVHEFQKLQLEKQNH
ncbi:MAG: hypothetical protein AAF939_18575, partial [Planctomycetota bacterium]